MISLAQQPREAHSFVSRFVRDEKKLVEMNWILKKPEFISPAGNPTMADKIMSMMASEKPGYILNDLLKCGARKVMSQAVFSEEKREAALVIYTGMDWSKETLFGPWVNFEGNELFVPRDLKSKIRKSYYLVWSYVESYFRNDLCLEGGLQVEMSLNRRAIACMSGTLFLAHMHWNPGIKSTICDYILEDGTKVEEGFDFPSELSRLEEGFDILQ